VLISGSLELSAYDNNELLMVTSRMPGDLTRCCAFLIEVFIGDARCVDVSVSDSDQEGAMITQFSENYEMLRSATSCDV